MAGADVNLTTDVDPEGAIRGLQRMRDAMERFQQAANETRRKLQEDGDQIVRKYRQMGESADKLAQKTRGDNRAMAQSMAEAAKVIASRLEAVQREMADTAAEGKQMSVELKHEIDSVQRDMREFQLTSENLARNVKGDNRSMAESMAAMAGEADRSFSEVQSSSREMGRSMFDLKEVTDASLRTIRREMAETALASKKMSGTVKGENREMERSMLEAAAASRLLNTSLIDTGGAGLRPFTLLILALIPAVAALIPQLSAVAAIIAPMPALLGAFGLAFAVFKDVDKKALEAALGFGKLNTTFQSLGKTLTAQLLPSFKSIGSAIQGPLIAGMKGAGDVIAKFAAGLAKFLSSKTGKLELKIFSEDSVKMLGTVLAMVGDLVKVFLAFNRAVSPVVDRFREWATSILDAFTAWAQSKSGQAQLLNFFKYAQDALENVSYMFAQLARLLVAFFRAGGEESRSFVRSIGDMFKSIADFLNGPGKKGLEEFWTSFKSAAVATAKAIIELWPYAKKAIDGVVGAIKTLADLIGGENVAKIALITAALLALAPAVAALISVLSAVAIVADVAFSWAGLVIAIGAALIVAYNRIKPFHEAVNNLAQAALHSWPQIKKLAEDVFHAVGRAVEWAVATARQAWARLVQIFGPLANQIAGDARKVVEFFKTHWPEIEKIGQRLWRNLKSAWESFGKPVLRDVGKIIESVARVWAREAQVMLTFAEDFVKWVAKHWPQISSVLNAVWTVVHPILRTFAAVIKAVADKAAALAQTIAKNMPTVKSQVTAIEGAVTGTFNAIAGAIDGVSSAISTMIGWIQSIPSIPGDVAKFLGGGGPSQHPSGPSRLGGATGGVVPGMGSSDTVPAMLTPGEVVLNRQQQQQFGGPGVFKQFFNNKGVLGSGGVRAFSGGGTVPGIGGVQIGDITPDIGHFTALMLKDDARRKKLMDDVKHQQKLITGWQDEKRHNLDVIDADAVKKRHQKKGSKRWNTLDADQVRRKKRNRKIAILIRDHKALLDNDNQKLSEINSLFDAVPGSNAFDNIMSQLTANESLALFDNKPLEWKRAVNNEITMVGNRLGFLRKFSLNKEVIAHPDFLRLVNDEIATRVQDMFGDKDKLASGFSAALPGSSGGGGGGGGGGNSDQLAQELQDQLTFILTSNAANAMAAAIAGNMNMQNIGSFAVGSPYIMQDQIAKLHKGEAVLPARMNPWNPVNKTGGGDMTGTIELKITGEGELTNMIASKVTPVVNSTMGQQMRLMVRTGRR